MSEAVTIERVQTGVRMERRMVQVLKGLAEFQNRTFAQLLEDIVLHSFEPPAPCCAAAEKNGKPACANANGERSREAIRRLKEVYGMDYDVHASYSFSETTGD